MLKKILLILLLITINSGWTSEAPLIIDHTCTNMEQIPLEYINDMKASSAIFHYATRSHGWQIITGVENLQETLGHDVTVTRPEMPDPHANALKLYVGMPHTDYPMPEDYFYSDYGMNQVRSLLTEHPEIKYSMFAWCTDLFAWYDSPLVGSYLDSLDQLETEFPEVTFIYMTPNVQVYDGVDDWGIWMRNENLEAIRQYCREHNKVLYDFADIECWKDGVQYTQHISIDDSEIKVDTSIAVQHPDYGYDIEAHTTVENCVKKGKAFWWMLARLNGWQPQTTDIQQQDNPTPARFRLSEAYPNPFNPATQIEFELAQDSRVTVNIFNIRGEWIAALTDDHYAAGIHGLRWNAASAASGIYFICIKAGGYTAMRKCLLVR